MGSKRKAQDELQDVHDMDGSVGTSLVFPKSDLSAVQDSRYASLYAKEVDFRSLSKQDAEFAAM